MVLIAVGESLKNLDKVTNTELFSQYSQVNWRQVKGIRDILSHHYFDINAEAIYDVCKEHLPLLHQTMILMLSDLNSGRFNQ